MKICFEKLNNEFIKINKLGWIESKRKDTTGIGYTFESLINLKENNLPIADYEEIEIKTFRSKSNQKIHLFNATPDGDFLFPIKRVLDILGYPDKINKEFKVFNMTLSTKKYTSIGYYKRAKIKINYNDEKIELIAINQNNEKYDINVSWSFELIKEKINNKIKNMAVIEANSKFINQKEYFHYKKILFYNIKDYKTFIKLIDDGIVEITFKIGVFKSGKRCGQIHDRGTDFSIYIIDINKLYNIVTIGC